MQSAARFDNTDLTRSGSHALPVDVVPKGGKICFRFYVYCCCCCCFFVVSPIRSSTVTCSFSVPCWKVLRTLCLEVDEASLLLQASAFGEDRAEAARVLGCEGRG